MDSDGGEVHMRISLFVGRRDYLSADSTDGAGVHMGNVEARVRTAITRRRAELAPLPSKPRKENVIQGHRLQSFGADFFSKRAAIQAMASVATSLAMKA